MTRLSLANTSKYQSTVLRLRLRYKFNQFLMMCFAVSWISILHILENQRDLLKLLVTWTVKHDRISTTLKGCCTDPSVIFLPNHVQRVLLVSRELHESFLFMFIAT